MSINSRAKGAGGEREFSNFLNSHGFTARRTQQFCGRGPDASDLICEELSNFHFEVKRTEKFHLYKAMAQAINDSKGKKIPVVAHRQNQQEWVAVIPVKELLKLIGVQWYHEPIE